MGKAAAAPRMATIERDGIEIEATWYGIRITVTDYDAGPVHVAREELAALRIIVMRPGTEPSEVMKGSKSKATATRVDGDWALSAGGVVVVAVREGLDVFVTDYDAEGARLWDTRLRRLGLERVVTETGPGGLR